MPTCVGYCHADHRGRRLRVARAIAWCEAPVVIDDLDPPLPGSLAALDHLDVAKGAYGGPRVARVSRALRVPVDALSSGELRFLLSEGRGLVHLLPAALGRLAADPWLACEAGPGDLLLAVCVAADTAWSAVSPWHRDLLAMLRAARAQLGALPPQLQERLEGELAVAEARFGA